MLVFEGMMNAKTIKPQGTDQSAIRTYSATNGHWQHTASRDYATAFWFALAAHTRLARCHHKSSCASTTPRTVSKPQRKPNMLLRNALEWLRDACSIQAYLLCKLA